MNLGGGRALNLNARQHTYEELRNVVVDVLSNRVNQFNDVLEYTGKSVAQRYNAPALPMGAAYPGAASQLHANDANLILEIVWDLFRQGVVTLGLNTSNPGWPWLRLSRFGKAILSSQNPFRFHDTTGYVKILTTEIPDISTEALVYMEEALSAFYADCLLSSTVMLGVAAETEFLRMLDIASRSPNYGLTFSSIVKLPFVRTKISKSQDAIKPHLKTLPKEVTEDLDTNLNAIQSVIRIARNEWGHPSA